MRIRGVLLAAALATASASCAREGPAAAPSLPGADGLVVDKALVDGYLIQVAHSRWDGGRTADLFDGDPATMARTADANPAVIEFRLREARPMRGVSLTTGGMEAGLKVTVRPETGGAKVYQQVFRNLPHDPTFGLDFDTGAAPIQSVRIELTDLARADGHIHIRAIGIQ